MCSKGGGVGWGEREGSVFLGAYLSCQRQRDDRVLHLTASRSNNCESHLSKKASLVTDQCRQVVSRPLVILPRTGSSTFPPRTELYTIATLYNRLLFAYDSENAVTKRLLDDKVRGMRGKNTDVCTFCIYINADALLCCCHHIFKAVKANVSVTKLAFWLHLHIFFSDSAWCLNKPKTAWASRKQTYLSKKKKMHFPDSCLFFFFLPAMLNYGLTVRLPALMPILTSVIQSDRKHPPLASRSFHGDRSLPNPPEKA